MLYYETVSPGLKDVLTRLMQMSELYSFCLVGGTSLALQIGHRSSVDIDLFTNKGFNSPALQSLLHNQFKQFTITWINQNGFSCIINGIKTDFFNWNVPFILLPYYEEDNIRLMPKEEIAAMKFEAITSRKEKKDFYDIAFLFKEYTFRQLFDIFFKKYGFYDKLMIIEALTTVDYADNSLDPVLFKEMEWSLAKKIIINAIEVYYQEQIANTKKFRKNGLVRRNNL